MLRLRIVFQFTCRLLSQYSSVGYDAISRRLSFWSWPLKMGPTGCLETRPWICHSTPRKSQKKADLTSGRKPQTTHFLVFFWQKRPNFNLFFVYRLLRARLGSVPISLLFWMTILIINKTITIWNVIIWKWYTFKPLKLIYCTIHWNSANM